MKWTYRSQNVFLAYFNVLIDLQIILSHTEMKLYINKSCFLAYLNVIINLQIILWGKHWNASEYFVGFNKICISGHTELVPIFCRNILLIILECCFYRFAEYLSGYSNMLLKICTMICQSFRHVVMDLQNMFLSYWNVLVDEQHGALKWCCGVSEWITCFLLVILLRQKSILPDILQRTESFANHS